MRWWPLFLFLIISMPFKMIHFNVEGLLPEEERTILTCTQLLCNMRKISLRKKIFFVWACCIITLWIALWPQLTFVNGNILFEIKYPAIFCPKLFLPFFTLVNSPQAFVIDRSKTLKSWRRRRTFRSQNFKNFSNKFKENFLKFLWFLSKI